MSSHAMRIAAAVACVLIVVASAFLARRHIAVHTASADAPDLPGALTHSYTGGNSDLYVAMASDVPGTGGIGRIARDCVSITKWRTGTPIDVAVDLFDAGTLWALETWPDGPNGDHRIQRYRRDGTPLIGFPVESSARYLASGRGRTNNEELYVVHMPVHDQPARLTVYSAAGRLERSWDLPDDPRGVALSDGVQQDRPVFVAVVGRPGHHGVLLRYDYWGGLIWEKPLDVIPVALTDGVGSGVQIAAVEPSAPDGPGVIVRVTEDAELAYTRDLAGITPIDLTDRWVLGHAPGEPLQRVLHRYDSDGKLVTTCDRFPQPSVPTPEGTAACPAPTPGAEAWRYGASGHVARVPAVADDGTVYAATSNGLMYAIDCTGRRKWLFDYRLESPSGRGAQAFEGAPAVDEDGTIYIGDDVVIPNYFFAILPNGTTKWVEMYENTWSQIDASPALADDGRIFTAAHGWGAGVNSGSILIVDRDGNRHRPDGWANEEGVGPITNSPALLAEGSAAYVSPPFHIWVMPTGTQATITPWATGTPTPTGTWASPTPRATRTATATIIRPTASPGTSPTPTPTGTEPKPMPFVVYLPAAYRGVSGEVAADDSVLAGPAQTLPYPYVTQPVPSRLRLVTGSLSDDIVVDLPGMRLPSSPAVHDLDIWFTAVADDGAHLLAYRVGDPPVLMLDWTIDAGVAGSPLLGRTDPGSGELAVYLLGTDGRLVRVDASADAGTARIRWSREIGVSAEGAPVLGDDGRVYAAAGQTVVALDRESGVPVWSLPLDNPVSGALNLAPGGMLLVPTTSGDVLAVGTASGGLDPQAAWPALRHDSRNTGSESTTIGR